MRSGYASGVRLTALDQCQAAVHELVEEPDEGPVLGDELVRIRQLVNRLEAVFQRRLARFDRDGGPAADGALSTTAWVRSRCRMAGSAAGARVQSARLLTQLDRCRAAFEAGDLSVAHVAVITGCARDVGVERLVEKGGEEILVELARQTDPQRVSWAAHHLRNLVDPDGAYDDFERNHDRRRLHLSRMLDGMFVINGQLDQEGGAILKTALEALMPPPAKDDLRDGPQRRADALVELAWQRLSAGDLPTSGGQKPHLVIFSSDAKLNGFIELAGAGPIPRKLALKLTSDAAVAVDGQPEHRTISPSLRRAVERRDRHCQAPGCDRPAGWCDGHHLRHWADGGPSTLENTALYCRRHHGLLFHDGFKKYKPPG
jgi:hypothetical protein